MQITLTWLVTR